MPFILCLYKFVKDLLLCSTIPSYTLCIMEMYNSLQHLYVQKLRILKTMLPSTIPAVYSTITVPALFLNALSHSPTVSLPVASRHLFIKSRSHPHPYTACLFILIFQWESQMSSCIDRPHRPSKGADRDEVNDASLFTSSMQRQQFPPSAISVDWETHTWSSCLPPALSILTAQERRGLDVQSLMDEWLRKRLCATGCGPRWSICSERTGIHTPTRTPVKYSVES